MPEFGVTEGSRGVGKSDIELFGELMSERFEEFRVDLHRELNRVIFGLIPTYVALLGLVVTIARLS
jgi:hypothetical protein